MSVIWKFPLTLAGENHVPLKKGAEILTVQMQCNVPCLWAICDPESPDETRTIVFYGTGETIPSGRKKYISTFQMLGDVLIFHAFEVLG